MTRLRLIGMLWISAGLLPATPITLGPGSITDTGWSTCGNFPSYACRTTAYFNTAESLYSQGNFNNLQGNNFQTEWDAWNNANGGQWTLSDDGGAFNSLTNGFNVTVAQAQQFSGVTLGGLTVTVQVTGSLPTLDAGYQYMWIQGLYDNYQIGGGPYGSIVTPFYELDVSSGACSTGNGGDRSALTMCPPAYPYQDQVGANSFYDQPKDYYQPPGSTQAFFDATAFFGEISYTDKTVKLYDGMTYGWQNYVSPEPSSWFLAIGGMLILLGRRRMVSRRGARCELPVSLHDSACP